MPGPYDTVLARMGQVYRKHPERFEKEVAPLLAGLETSLPGFNAAAAPMLERARSRIQGDTERAQIPEVAPSHVPLGAATAESVRSGVLGAGRTLLAGPALAETYGREVLNLVGDWTGHGQVVDPVGEYGPLASYVNAGRRQQQIAENIASYDSRTGAAGVAEEVALGLAQSAPSMALGGIGAGAAPQAALGVAQRFGPMAAQAFIAAAASSQGAADQAAADMEGITAREATNVVAQGLIEGVFTRGSPGGVERAFVRVAPTPGKSAGKVVVEFGKEVGGEAIEEGGTSATQLIAENIIYDKPTTPEQLAHDTMIGSLTGSLAAAGFQAPHAIVDTAAALQQQRPSMVPAPPVGPDPIMGDALATAPEIAPERVTDPLAETQQVPALFQREATDAATPEGQAAFATAQSEAAFGDYSSVITEDPQHIQYLMRAAAQDARLTPEDAVELQDLLAGVLAETSVPTPEPVAAPVAVPEPVAAPVKAASVAVPEPVKTEPVKAESTATEVQKDTAKLVSRLTSDMERGTVTLQLETGEDAVLNEVDEDAGTVMVRYRDETGDVVDVEVPFESIAKIRSVAPVAKPKLDPKPIAKPAAKPIPPGMPGHVPAEPTKHTFDNVPVTVHPAKGRKTLPATAVTKVGNAHAVAELADGSFVVVGQNRANAKKSISTGAPIRLVTIDPELGHAPKKPKDRRSYEVVYYGTFAEAEAVAKTAEVRMGETESIASGDRKQKAQSGGSVAADVEKTALDSPASLLDTATRRDDLEALEMLADLERAHKRGDTATRDTILNKVRARLKTTKADRVAEREAVKAEPEPEATPSQQFLGAVNPQILPDALHGKTTAQAKAMVVDAAEAVVSGIRASAEATFDAVMKDEAARGRTNKVLAVRRAVQLIASSITQSTQSDMKSNTVPKPDGSAQAAMNLVGREANLLDAKWDGMTTKSRVQSLQAAADAFGVKLIIVSHPLSVNGKPVQSLFDPTTKTAMISSPMSFQHGVRLLVHEAMHDELLAMPAAARQAVYDSVLSSLTDAGSVVRGIRRRWGKALPRRRKKDARYTTEALDEMLSDAAVEAVLTNRDNILTRLPARIGQRMMKVFAKLGNTLMKIAKRLPGLRGVFGSKPEVKAQRNAVIDIAQMLLGRRLDALKAAQKTQENWVDSFTRAIGHDAEYEAEIKKKLEHAARKTPEGDMHQSLLDKIKGMSTEKGATDIVRASVQAWGDTLEVGRNFPVADQVIIGFQKADRAWKRSMHTFEDKVIALLGIKNAALRVKTTALMYDLRNENRTNPFKDYAAGIEWLRQTASDRGIDVDQAERLTRSVHEAWQEARANRLDAAARLMGLSRAFNVDETAALIAQYRQLFPEEQIAEDLERLELWKDVATKAEEATDLFYIPYARLPRDLTLLVRDPATDRVIHRETVGYANQKERTAALTAQYAGSTIDALPSTSTDLLGSKSQQDAFSKLENRLRAIVARTPGVGGGRTDGDSSVQTEANVFISQLMRGLLADSAAAHELQAKGIPGYDLDPQDVFPYVFGGLSQSIRSMNTADYAGPAMEALAQDTKRPRLYEFMHGITYGTGSEAADEFTGWATRMRMMASARALFGVPQTIQNTVAGFTLAPFMLAHITGKSAKSVSTMYGEMFSSTFDMYVRGAGTLREAASLATGAQARGAPSWYEKQAMSRMTPAMAKDYKRARIETDVLFDPEASRFAKYLASQADTIALQISRAMHATSTASDMAVRTSLFSTAWQIAHTFDEAGWAKAEANGYHRERTAYDYAVWATQYTLGDYSRRFRPELARGAVGGAAYQFTTWRKRMTHQVNRMVAEASADAKKGDLRALGRLAAMGGIGVALHGLRGGVPIYGGIIAALLSGYKWFDDDEDKSLDQAVLTAIAEAEKKGDASAAFIVRALHYGVPHAAAMTKVPGVRQAGQLTSPILEAAAPRGLIYDSIMSMRVGVLSMVGDVVAGGTDIALGVKNKSPEAVGRGLARIGGRPFVQAAKLPPLVGKENKGILEPTYWPTGENAEPIVSAKSLTAADKVMAAITLALGAEPVQGSEAMAARRLEQEARTATTGRVSVLVSAVATAIRTGDKAQITETISDLTTYATEQIERLKTAEGAQKARVMAELAWLREGGIAARVREAYLQQEYGDARPKGGAGAMYRDYLNAAAGLEFDANEDEDSELGEE